MKKRPRISAFPKCYLEEISQKRTMSVFDWIQMAKDLPAEGLEMYEGFLWELTDSFLGKLSDELSRCNFEMPMLCCSPDFTHPERSKRVAAVEYQKKMIEVAFKLGGAGTVCRVLSGQRWPEVDLQRGLDYASEGILACIPTAQSLGVVLGIENHYKDGFWLYPEFAQKKDDLKHAEGSAGYSKLLLHGVTGKGLNNYSEIFRRLSDSGYSGWISIEDGMNGMGEMRESLLFLQEMVETFYPTRE